VVTLLFGNAYVQAGSVLSIHIWSGLFVFLGLASGKWFIIEGLQRYSFYRTLFGAVANIVLNLIMIPKFGVLGAASATVISYAIAGLFSDVLQKETRTIFKMKLRSLNIYSTLISIWRKPY